MKKMVNGAASAALMLSAFAPVTFVGLASPAQAASPSEEKCLAEGGDFYRINGQVLCIKEDHVGNSDKSQTVTDYEGSNGTLNNKPKHQEDCDGTGNTSAPQDHCD